jgi:hypothetical protein
VSQTILEEPNVLSTPVQPKTRKLGELERILNCLIDERPVTASEISEKAEVSIYKVRNLLSQLRVISGRQIEVFDTVEKDVLVRARIPEQTIVNLRQDNTSGITGKLPKGAQPWSGAK